MTTNRSSAGGPDRKPPEPRSWVRPPGLALVALALAGLVQSGCQSFGCNDCGGFGSRLSSGVQSLGARVSESSSRLFHHKKGGCSTCGDGGMEGGTIVDSGIPVAPGGMVVPGPATIVPAPSLEQPPVELSPIEGNGASRPANPTGGAGSANPSSTRSQPANNRSAYEAYLPRNKSARGRTTDVARAIHSSPEQQARAGYAIPRAESNDLLDHIPPVDVPAEVTQKAVSLPATISAPSPAAAPAVARPPAGPATEAGKVAAPTPAETVSAAEGAPSAVTARLAPGIRRSGSVAPSVGGGSAPSAEGLDWLKEKGYRTFLDLRSMTEIDPNFVESVNDHGMVYLSLPIVADRLDPSRLSRFDDLITQSENRPLYFCDADGTRAGLVWYIHLRTVEGNDPQSAYQRAEEIGLSEAQARLGEAYLSTHRTKARSVAPLPAAPPAAAPSPASQPAAKAEAPTPAPALPASSPAPAPAPVATPEDTSPAPTLPGEGRSQASAAPAPYRSREPMAWRPVAALVLTGIGVPLAYWSKSALSDACSNRLRRRMASLPGSARRSIGAPTGSDA